MLFSILNYFKRCILFRMSEHHQCLTWGNCHRPISINWLQFCCLPVSVPQQVHCLKISNFYLYHLVFSIYIWMYTFCNTNNSILEKAGLRVSLSDISFRYYLYKLHDNLRNSRTKEYVGDWPENSSYDKLSINFSVCNSFNANHTPLVLHTIFFTI